MQGESPDFERALDSWSFASRAAARLVRVHSVLTSPIVALPLNCGAIYLECCDEGQSS
jgi:hypothetical protein